MFVKGSHKFSRVLPKSWTQTQLVGLGNFWSSPFLLRPEGWAATSQEDFQGCRERRCSTCAGEKGRVSQIILAEEWEVRRRTRKCWEERSGLRDLGNSLKIYCLLSSRVQHSHKCKDTGEFGSGSGFKSSNLLYSKKKKIELTPYDFLYGPHCGCWGRKGTLGQAGVLRPNWTPRSCPGPELAAPAGPLCCCT